MLKSSQTHSLLVIDDRPLRRQSFRGAAQVIRKIDRIEEVRRSFETEDQQLYKQWFAKTFVSEQEQIYRLQSEFKRLGQFHNWIIATAELQHIPMYEAYRIIKDEEKAYAKADASERARIDEAREFRDRYIEDKVYDRYSGGDQDSKTQKRSEAEEELFVKLWETCDSDLKDICEDEEMAFELLSLAARLSHLPEDYQLFLRVWELTPAEHQQEFSIAFKRKHGASVEDAISEMREAVRQAERCKVSGEEKAENESRGSASSLTSKLKPEDEEKIKILYRRLVRRLHPDMQWGEKDNLPSWHRLLWERTQKAYRERDLPEIEKLLRITFLRLKQFQNLSISEILESRSWLEQELTRLKHETKQLRKLPAWGFSKMRSDASLIKRLRRDFARDIEVIQTKILQLQREHVRWQRLNL